MLYRSYIKVVDSFVISVEKKNSASFGDVILTMSVAGHRRVNAAENVHLWVCSIRSCSKIKFECRNLQVNDCLSTPTPQVTVWIKALVCWERMCWTERCKSKQVIITTAKQFTAFSVLHIATSWRKERAIYKRKQDDHCLDKQDD